MRHQLHYRDRQSVPGWEGGGQGTEGIPERIPRRPGVLKVQETDEVGYGECSAGRPGSAVRLHWATVWGEQAEVICK